MSWLTDTFGQRQLTPEERAQMTETVLGAPLFALPPEAQAAQALNAGAVQYRATERPPEPAVPPEELAPQRPPEAPAPQETQDPRERRFQMSGAILGMPRLPGVPQFAESKEAAAQAYATSLDAAQQAEQATTEHYAKVDAELRAGQAATADMQMTIDKQRRDVDRAIDERITMAEFPNAESPKRVRELQDIIKNPDVYQPWQVEEAQKELKASRVQGGTEKVLGPWYKTLMAALAMGMGAFGASLTGGPNMAMQIINSAIDRADREEQDKAARLDKVLAAKERKGYVQLERTKEDFIRQQEQRAGNLALLQHGLAAEMAKITNLEKRAAAEALYGQVTAQLEQTKATIAGQRATLQMQGAVAQMKAAEKAAGAPGFAGLEYKPGAQPLETGERQEVRKAVGSYNKLFGRIKELRQKAENMSAAGYVSWSKEGKDLAGAFGRTIDAIRNNENWGARLEATEVGRLIPGYLGKEEASDFGYFVDVLRATERTFQSEFQNFIDAYDMQVPGRKQRANITMAAPKE